MNGYDDIPPVFLQNIFIGVILTATSVSISVETLKELGRLNTKVGNAILGAALIDDVIGIVALTVITSLAGESSDIFSVLIKIAAFFAASVIAGIIFRKLFEKWVGGFTRNLSRFVIVAFTFCLAFSYCAEQFFGVADITGAFIAGIIISGTQRTKFIASRFNTLSFMFLTPVFFASIGIQVAVPHMDANILWFCVLITVAAVVTKIAGAGLGAMACKYTPRESLQVGVGMVSRGEVALIIANKGLAMGLMTTVLFGPVVVMVIATTILTPIFLKLTFRRKAGEEPEKIMFTDLAENYQEVENLELAQQTLLEWHHESIEEQSDK